METARVYFVMGVSGSGKSTIGQLLATALGLPFTDGDDVHPPDNKARMAAGQPLRDIDRWPWLEALHVLARHYVESAGGVIACSALRESYREVLTKGISEQCTWIFLDGEEEVIYARMAERQGHFMPQSLLASQFETLEKPANAIHLSILETPDVLVGKILARMNAPQIGIIGMGVMGRSLAVNFASKGYRLALYNRYVPGVEEAVAEKWIATHPELHGALGFEDMRAFVSAIPAPRKILMMVNAGSAVDTVIEGILPYLTPGDVLADGGNSKYTDTALRQKRLSEKGIRYLGIGISGGEEGALRGPAMMAGGDRAGYAMFEESLLQVAARDADAAACCAFFGPQGSGHFIKMVHNGIEYAEMQLIAECVALLRSSMPHEDAADVLEQWNNGEEASFLLEITIQILRRREGDGFLLDQVSDVARSKGTGAWTVQAADALGMPSPVIAAALHARYQSARAEERHMLTGVVQAVGEQRPISSEALRRAYALARVINHHLGFELIRRASEEYNWDLDLSEIARVWTNGCIIRSKFMEKLPSVLPESVLQAFLLTQDSVPAQTALRDVVASGARDGFYMPCHSAALQTLLGYRTEPPVMHVIQAQRDLFGAHGYERKDDHTGKQYHSTW